MLFYLKQLIIWLFNSSDWRHSAAVKFGTDGFMRLFVSKLIIIHKQKNINKKLNLLCEFCCIVADRATLILEYGWKRKRNEWKSSVINFLFSLSLLLVSDNLCSYFGRVKVFLSSMNSRKEKGRINAALNSQAEMRKRKLNVGDIH